MTFKFSIDDFKNYSTTEPIKNIFIIENFLSENEKNLILNYINSLSEKDWESHYINNLKDFCMRKFGRDDVDNLVAEGKFEITPSWKDKNISLYNNEKIELLAKSIEKKIMSFIKEDSNLVPVGLPGVVQRMQTGSELVAHYDKYTDPSIQYAGVIYINDDYLDGELFFSNKNFQIKPKSRTLVIFPGTEEFTHGVKIVGDGPTRYVLPGFISIKNFYNEEKIKEFNNNYSS